MRPYSVPDASGPFSSRPFNRDVLLTRAGLPIFQIYYGDLRTGELIAETRQDWTDYVVDACNRRDGLVKFKTDACKQLGDIAEQLQGAAQNSTDPNTSASLNSLATQIQEFLSNNP